MNFAARKEALQARRIELAGHLMDVEHALDEQMPKDWEDRASERQGDEVLESLGQAELDELRMIDAALDRLKDGSYGFCQKCGSEISSERLDLIPATPFCRNCAV